MTVVFLINRFYRILREEDEKEINSFYLCCAHHYTVLMSSVVNMRAGWRIHGIRSAYGAVFTFEQHSVYDNDSNFDIGSHEVLTDMKGLSLRAFLADSYHSVKAIACVLAV